MSVVKRDAIALLLVALLSGLVSTLPPVNHFHGWSIDILTATLDDPNAFPPDKEIWVSHKLDWEQLNDALPHFPESSRKQA